MLHIKLVKSPIGNNPRNRRCVEALGLRKISQVVVHEDNPSIRGMIHKVKHMLVVTSDDGAKIVDATNPGSSARMVSAKIHKKSMVAPKQKKGDQK